MPWQQLTAVAPAEEVPRLSERLERAGDGIGRCGERDHIGARSARLPVGEGIETGEDHGPWLGGIEDAGVRPDSNPGRPSRSPPWAPGGRRAPCRGRRTDR